MMATGNARELELANALAIESGELSSRRNCRRPVGVCFAAIGKRLPVDTVMLQMTRF